jgi:hypothetical protein
MHIYAKNEQYRKPQSTASGLAYYIARQNRIKLEQSIDNIAPK